MGDRLSDLPLFAWRPKPNVLPFPFSRCKPKVEETASNVLAREGEAADAYMVLIATGIERHLSAGGFGAIEIDCEVAAFVRAVQLEMVRMIYAGPRSQPDGGAA